MSAEPDVKVGMADFVASAGLSMTCRSVVDNPHMDGAERMDNWKCLIRAGRSRMTVYFSKGIGHKGAEPEIGEVLDCLASDAAGVENNATFDSWCSEYSYDTDSRRAERTYNICAKQAAKLRALLGDSAYETLLWKVERQ